MTLKFLPLDSNGIPFSQPTYWLHPKEYGKICSEINQIYETQYKEIPVAIHPSFGLDGMAYIYWFENHGFADYNIFLKLPDNY